MSEVVRLWPYLQVKQTATLVHSSPGKQILLALAMTATQRRYLMSLKFAYRCPYEYSGPAMSHRRVTELSAQENTANKPTLCYYADKIRR